MGIDFKTIFLVILIVGVIGAAVYIGIEIMFKSPSSVEIDDTSNIDNSNNVKSDIVELENKIVNNDLNYRNIDTNNMYENTLVSNEVGGNISDDKLSQIYGTGLNINNNNPKNDLPQDAYYSVSFSLPGSSRCIYYVPNTWEREGEKIIDPITESNIICRGSKTSDFMEVKYNITTYEDVLNAFAEKEARNAIYPDDIGFSTRQLVTDGGTYTILIKKDGDKITSYILFIKGTYEYHLELTAKEENYNDDLIKIIDNVFSSFKIS